MQAHDIAQQNFDRLIRTNPYPGRGLVIGRMAGDDAWVMVYWIMGRSPNSQNRQFVVEGDMLRAEPLDAQLVSNPELIIYEAIRELPHVHLVGNGKQVQALYEGLLAGSAFDDVLANWEREPDPPIYTPRITGMLDMQTSPASLTLNILKAHAANPELTDRFTYRPAPLPPGLGMGLTTYQGEGNPPPSFAGEPPLLPCLGNAQTILDTYWNALNADFRVALAVKWIPDHGKPGEIMVRNRFDGA
ncbi:MAG: inosine monophosphate cyclohydrolase [Anaerolineae bacterium]|nr:inosine monophosphate cyclohydrolase [Anaerolineae bacterium]